jgi:hypothetical protein
MVLNFLVEVFWALFGLAQGTLFFSFPFFVFTVLGVFLYRFLKARFGFSFLVSSFVCSVFFVFVSCLFLFFFSSFDFLFSLIDRPFSVASSEPSFLQFFLYHFFRVFFVSVVLSAVFFPLVFLGSFFFEWFLVRVKNFWVSVFLSVYFVLFLFFCFLIYFFPGFFQSIVFFIFFWP